MASLFTITAAFAYSRGRGFRAVVATVSMIILAILVTVDEIILLTWGQAQNILITTLELAPDVVIGSVAGVSLGWVFFVRWGGLAGWLFLLVTVGYALLQLPANIWFSLRHFLSTTDARTLEQVFALLAGGKVLVIFGVLLLLCSSSRRTVNIDQPKHWPEHAVPLPAWGSISPLVGWVPALITAVIVAIFTDPLKCVVMDWIGHPCSP
jgi:hypothetical protein